MNSFFIKYIYIFTSDPLKAKQGAFLCNHVNVCNSVWIVSNSKSFSSTVIVIEVIFFIIDEQENFNSI